DDIDVSMPRKDFKKLIKIAKDEFGDKYFLQTHKTEKNCSFYYAKLRKNGTFFGEEKFGHRYFHKGIFIDIFPLDYIPENKVLQKLIFKSFGLMSGLISSKDKTDNYLFEDKSKATLFLLKPLCILPKGFISALRTGIAKLSNILSNKKLLASLSGFHGYPMEISPEIWWSEGCDIAFEDKTVRAPKEYDKFLRHMFGDYMILPPEEERITHNVNPDKIIFDGATYEDYKPKTTAK
ncbi:MAG: LicD family protein, partial [Ruminococcus sp.]|nr:LicD family protein [Ruminococcus sp.]